MRLLASSCLFDRMKKVGDHWTDIQETWFWKVLLKFVNTLKFWLKSDNKNGHFAWTLHVLLRAEVTAKFNLFNAKKYLEVWSEI
jgi:hypothetical protein